MNAEKQPHQPQREFIHIPKRTKMEDILDRKSFQNLLQAKRNLKAEAQKGQDD